MSKLQVDDIVNKEDTGSPGFSKGVVVTGVCTATSFDGDIGNATGLTGSPDIAVTNVTSGIVTATSFDGSGASITNIDADNITAGIVTTARLGGGTANATTFLNGHGQFAEAGGGSWTYLATVNASSSTTMDFTSGIDSTYDTYVFVGDNLVPSSDGGYLYVQLYNSGTSTWNELFHNYQAQSWYISTRNDSYAKEADRMILGSQIGYASPSNTESHGGLSFIHYLKDPSSTTQYKIGYGNGSCRGYNPTPQGTQAAAPMQWATYYESTNAITGARFGFQGYTVTSGTIRMYGIKNS